MHNYTSLPLTPRAEKVLNLAQQESIKLGHKYVGTEHFLLGLLLESSGVAAHVLRNFKLNPQDVRQEILELLGAERSQMKEPSAMKTVRAEFKLMSEYEENGKIVPLDPEFVKLPAKKHQEDAGYDVTSAESGVIKAGDCRNFHTGVRVAVPLGWYYEVKGRSGLGFDGIIPFNGILDSTYNGELRILLFNHSEKDYHVNKGDRIAQILFYEQVEMNPKEVEEFSPEYDKRGIAGFGSSGR